MAQAPVIPRNSTRPKSLTSRFAPRSSYILHERANPPVALLTHASTRQRHYPGSSVPGMLEIAWKSGRVVAGIASDPSLDLSHPSLTVIRLTAFRC